jgi:two-component system chemotaxis response regulator CheV
MAHGTGILLATGTNEMEIVEFYLDELTNDGSIYRGSYGINVAKVLEIIREPKVNRLPLAPPAMSGTFLLRDKVIPLIDLAVQLEKKKPEQEVNPLAIVTEFNKATLAFGVSGVNRIHRMAWSEIEPAGTSLGRFSNSLTGIVKLEDRNVLILDMEKILSELTPQYAVTDTEQISSGNANARFKALIADDSASIRKILVGKLAKDGFDVQTANDGQEAWTRLLELKELARKEKRHIDDYVQVIVTDIEMPQMDGYSLCRAIKQDGVLGNLPVILFSSLINDRLLHKGKSVGADEQITKPEIADLGKKARELIGKHRS